MSTTISCFYHRSKSNSVEYRVYHCVTSNCDPSKSDKGTSVHIIASTSSLFKHNFFEDISHFFSTKYACLITMLAVEQAKSLKKISLRENPKWWLKDVNRSQAILYYIDRMNWYKMNWCKKGRKKTNNFVKTTYHIYIWFLGLSTKSFKSASFNFLLLADNFLLSI